MLEIRPIQDLRNTNEISKLCHRRNKPVYITKNGYGHLVVMSMETYKDKLAKAELYKKLAEVEVLVREETILATLKTIAELFGVDRTTISRHFKNVFETGELVEKVVCAEIEHTT